MPTSSGWSKTWTFYEGDWHEGNVPLMGVRSHAAWLGSSVFDGARAFEGVAPDLDLHCVRVNNSAERFFLEPQVTIDAWLGLARDGMRRFETGAALYIRPMYWAEQGGPLLIAPKTELHPLVSVALRGADARAGWVFADAVAVPQAVARMHAGRCQGRLLYPNNGRALIEAQGRGFDNCIMRDLQGNVAELATANVFMAKDGVVFTPAANGTFLNEITRQRVIGLLRLRRDIGRRNHDAVRGVRGGRRDLLERQLFQGGAGGAHRRALAATRAALPQGARALLGICAFENASLSIGRKRGLPLFGWQPGLRQQGVERAAADVVDAGIDNSVTDDLGQHRRRRGWRSRTRQAP